LLETVVAQLAEPDADKYQATIRNIIVTAMTPQHPECRAAIQRNLGTHFLQLAIDTPLTNLPEPARAFVLNIIREQASVTPDSDWTKAVQLDDHPQNHDDLPHGFKRAR
jgi:hypothetical protein